jgi:broad-specificity NMP kinase
MSKFSIIIITGLPAAGKTTLSKKLSAKLKIPLVSKDAMKELLFNNLGWSDREWSKKLGMATFDLIYYMMEVQMAAEKPFIVETNFKHEFDSKKFMKLKKKHSFHSIQIICESEGKILYDRFKRRSTSSKRHPGHRDEIVCGEIKSHLLKGEYKPLQIGGEIIKVNTSNFSLVNIDALTKKLKSIVYG